MTRRTARRPVALAALACCAALTCASPATGASTAAWPGGSTVRAADATFGPSDDNVSGLAYESATGAAPSHLWAVRNGPSTLYELTYNTTKRAWGEPGKAGHTLTYPDGTGTPDSEGVTLVDGSAADGVYVSAERDNTHAGTSRLSVLRYAPGDDPADTSSLSATQEWDLTDQLPSVAPNLGLESVAWVPDSYLTAKGFRDASSGGLPYDPTQYTAHAGGVFFAALEGTGAVYGFVLQDDGTATEVTGKVTSGLAGVMDLSWEPEKNRLWAVCDNTCAGRSVTLGVAGNGLLAPKAAYARPSGMPNDNNEGFTTTPRSECSPTKRTKHVFWAADRSGAGPVLRQGTISCTPPA